MQAIWKGQVIARSDDTIVVEGNHYFPEHSLDAEVLRPSDTTSYCNWKGTAHYYHLVVAGQQLEDAAWYYPDPLPQAQHIQGHVAFWNGVQVEPSP